MDVGALFDALRTHHELAQMSLFDLIRFIRRTHLLKDDICLPQPRTVPVNIAPDLLPPAIITFLAQSFTISSEAVHYLWAVVKHLAWTLPGAAEERADEEAAFEIYGHQLGLSEFSTVLCANICNYVLTSEIARCVLYPPVKTCINPECTAQTLGSLLKKEEQRCVVIFTHANGAHPAWSVHLKC